MAREQTNGKWAAVCRQRTDRACWGFRSGVVGWWQLDLTSQDGVMVEPVPTYCGPAWGWWLSEHDLGDEILPSVLTWPKPCQTYYYIAVAKLMGLIDKLTKPGVHGDGWLRLAGDGDRLFEPACKYHEAIAAVGPPV